MDGQPNHAASSAHHQPSENQNPLHSESAPEEYASFSHGQASSSHQQGRQEASSVQNSSQITGPTPAQSSQIRQEENEPEQRQNGSNTSINAQSSIRDQARVAVVIYDMLIRAGPEAEALSAQLARAYPLAAALARHCAMFATPLRPYFEVVPTNPSQRRGSLVLRRVSVSSVAWFSSFIASIFALLRLWMIFSLALGATIATTSDNVLIYQVVDHVVSLVIERGPNRQLYRWMFALLNERSPLVALGTNAETTGGILAMMPNQAATALLITPVTSGIVGFIMGVLAALCINSALRAAGGIRLESHED